MKLLLSEDECAPDAKEYFEKEMKNKYGLTFNLFKECGKISEPNESTIEWHYNSFVLSYHADDPFYKLSKI